MTTPLEALPTAELAGEDSLLRDYPPARAEYANTGEDDNLADLGLDSDAEADHQPQDQADEQQDGAEADVPEALEGEAMDEDAQADQEIEEDENASIQADEAEEELPAVSKKRSEAQELQAMREEVRALIARMEQAVEKDIDNLLEGKPATRKLQMLPEIDDAMAKVKMHDMLLQYGFVGLLKAFLEPMKTQKVGRDGDRVPTLPHAQVRAAVYRALQKLPINTLDISCRHMLKSAQIGPVLRFYAEVRDEDPINRKMVNDLLNRWMAPIVEEGRKAVANAEHDELRKQDELAQLKRQRQLEREVSARDAKRMAASQEGKKVGDAGYRYHARVPRFAQPAYVNAPEVPDSARRVGAEKGAKDKGNRARINKTTLQLQRQKKGVESRAGKVELSTKKVGNDVV